MEQPEQTISRVADECLNGIVPRLITFWEFAKLTDLMTPNLRCCALGVTCLWQAKQSGDSNLFPVAIRHFDKALDDHKNVIPPRLADSILDTIQRLKNALPDTP